jgi:gamma-glutamylaminecyclotransferase
MQALPSAQPANITKPPARGLLTARDLGRVPAYAPCFSPVTLVRLFVYGSLKRGFEHHAELAGAELEGPVDTAPDYRMVLQGAYPALARGGVRSVRGELYRVRSELLVRLDWFEGCPELYRRETIVLADGSTAFAYLIDEQQAEHCTDLGDGEWRQSALHGGTGCTDRD